MPGSPRRAGGARPPGTAFVLSGGGNQGVAQVGMLRALLEHGIVPDVVVGTSAGALNGCSIATSPTLERVDELERVWLGLRGEQVFPGGVLKRAWNVLRRDDHLSPSEGLLGVVESAGSAADFASLEVPLRVVTTDLDTGDEILIVSGPTAPALLASAAIPGIFPPVELNGHRLVDGAVVNLVPISHALAGPTGRIFVLDVSDPLGDRPIRSPLDVAIRAFAISRDQRFELELQWVPPDVEVVVLPAPRDDREFFDFSGGGAIVNEAYKLASDALDEYEGRSQPRSRRFWAWGGRGRTLRRSSVGA
ncbi:MAG TPA: patatin-like phospholipase family protein [Acidimicrobiia bacterium]|nr:patatin-like phospholipase family protein [Acidimicrobiia bacterium]